MIRHLSNSLRPLLLLCSVTTLCAEPTPPLQDSLLGWMKEQVALHRPQLEARSTAPLLQLAYRIDDHELWSFSADRGAPVIDFPEQSRTLHTSILFGSPEFASSRPLTWYPLPPEARGATNELPIHFSRPLYEREVRQATEWSYRQARDHFAQLQSERQTQISEEQSGLDFAPALFAQKTTPLQRSSPDSTHFQRLRREIVQLSSRWRNLSWLHGASIDFSWRRETSRLVASDAGSALWGSDLTALSITLLSRTPDGLDLMESQTWSFNTLPRGLDTTQIATAIDSMLAQLLALRTAPMGEPYAGPVLLEGPAAAVFVHEVLGHRLESHRLKKRSDGQTFLRKRGELIAPVSLSLIDDPTLSEWNGTPLHGHYEIDDEGVLAQRASLIEKGKLVGLLNSRTTAITDDSSNGHGRGRPALSRMGNTIFQYDNPVTIDSLRRQLLTLAKERNLPYALVIQDLQGGYTITGRELPQSFQLLALSAKKIWVDGRPDELIRGINLSGSPLSSLAHLVGASDRMALFNGFCGAENGWVPVSALSPDLLFSTLEAEIQPTRSGTLPLLSPPSEEL